MQIDKDLNSDYAELFLDVKEFLISELENYVEQITEKYSQNITTLYGKGFCSAFGYIKVKDDYIHIGWFLGRKINDKFGLLLGDGKHIRGQKIKLLDKISKEAISYYAEQSYILLVEKQALQSR